MTYTSLRTPRFATLAAVLAVTSATGCDVSDVDLEEAADTDAPDEVGSSTGGDDEDDAEADESGDESGGGDESTGGEGDDPTGDPAPPFDDDPAAALGALAGMGYSCFDAEDTRYTLLFRVDGVTVRFDDDTTSEGTYEASTDALSISFPELGFAEGATEASFALDALVYFETPSLQCGAFVFDHTAQGGTDVVTCPTIKYIPETSWEENEFQFGPGGYVLRRSWTELPAVPDTLYSARAGLYRRIGDQVYMALPFEDEGEQWLTATVTDEGLFIDQLEPERGACE